MPFWAFLQHNLLNIYWTEECFEQKLYKKT
jgi:hypothetical protein